MLVCELCPSTPQAGRHALGEAVLAGPADVVHHLVRAGPRRCACRIRPAMSSSASSQRDPLPLARAARARALAAGRGSAPGRRSG